MTDKEMLIGIAVLEGTVYSETENFPGLGECFDPPFSIEWVLEDLEVDEKRSTLEERRKRLLDWYFGLPSAKPKSAVELAALTVGV